MMKMTNSRKSLVLIPADLTKVIYNYLMNQVEMNQVKMRILLSNVVSVKMAKSSFHKINWINMNGSFTRDKNQEKISEIIRNGPNKYFWDESTIFFTFKGVTALLGY